MWPKMLMFGHPCLGKIRMSMRMIKFVIMYIYTGKSARGVMHRSGRSNDGLV